MDYAFDRTISRAVLENYLAHAITMQGLSDSSQMDEDFRMLKNIGAKYIGRASYLWGEHTGEDSHFGDAGKMISGYHQLDPDAIFQACIFEVVYESIVSGIPIPAWVFEEFGLPVETRNFRYAAMLYDGNCAHTEPVKWVPNPGNHWMHDYFGKGASVPDMSKLEAQLWFFYRARRYIDAGFEALHLGQVHLMIHNDPGALHWWSVLSRIRRYGARTARRHMVILDAHTWGVRLDDGHLLFDFHSYPMLPKDVLEKPGHCVLEAGFREAIFGRSMGGIAPSGWSCDHLPFIVEFDNWSSSGKPGEHIDASPWVWGCDEICWFARQPEAYRNEFLHYAHHRVPELDSNGHLQMPGYRGLADPVEGRRYYHANTASPACPEGFNQENIIKQLWKTETHQAAL